jgi:3-hydroxyisobutyrate dehydrogenase-like beta-hydroxyacid dehydrogenase
MARKEKGMRIGIMGLGRCGMPAAEKYLQSGYQVFGYDRLREVLSRFESLGGIPVESPAQAAGKAETIIVLVLNDEQVMQVVTGRNGVLERATPESTVVCMSTINRDNLEFVADRCAAREVRFVDSPFTGGPARITAGTLTLIAAASPEALETARPILEVIGKITVAGDKPGMGQAVKHCNQLLVTAIHAATIELITLAERSGVDPKLVCEVVGSGIGGNDYFRLLSKAILEDTTSPGGMGQLWKDVNIVVNSGRRHNLPLLVATAASHYFNMAISQGMAEEDSARLIEVMHKMLDRQERAG